MLPPEEAKRATISDEHHSEMRPCGAELEDVSRNGHEDSSLESGAAPVKEQVVQDPNIVDWDGPNDPANPLNWPLGKKLSALFIVSFITLLSPLASTIIAPGTESVMEEFHSSNSTLAAFVTSVYLLGYVFGPLVIAPLSELYGRVPLYNACNLFFLIFIIACAVANSLGSLIVFRLLTGIAASCPVTIGAGSIADMIPQERRGLAMAAWVVGPLLGPVLGPLAGGYLTQAKGWRWNFWLLSILVGATAIATLLIMHESYPYVLLERKAKRLRKQTGNLNLRSALHTSRTAKEQFNFSIIRPLKMLFLSPIVFLLSLYAATIYSYLYLCFTTFPRIFEQQYGFSKGTSGLAYLGIGIGSLLGLFLIGGISDRLFQTLTKRNGGTSKPEYRLPTLIIGALMVPIGLFLYGWAADKRTHWIVPLIGTSFLGCGMVIAFMVISNYLVDAYTVYSASAIAANTVFRSLLGALLPLAGGSMYDALGVGWGTSVLAFISVAFTPLSFIFIRYGERIRESNLFKVEF